ncbi:Cytosine/purine/uracil/thiamine/allantoin permease family protein [Pseudomonas sp. R3-52-08]|nr:Cytosine/purine/uracil/thiamine/allantoin permease family protein [Pseudomonas sp. R3-52-08]
MNNKNNQNSIRTIETNGVEQIPDHERTAAPKDLFRLIFGGANTFATAVYGPAAPRSQRTDARVPAVAQPAV